MITEAASAGATVPLEPIVSWLLCTHRKDALLHRAIASCLGQSMQAFELLIVVNGPRHQEIASELEVAYMDDSRVRILSTPVQLLNFSLSLGLHAARTPLLARMDGDDVAAPDRLLRQVAFMQAHPEITVLGSAYRLIDANGGEHGVVALPTNDADIRAALYWKNPICHPAVMLRRDPILALGGYLGGQNAEDYDLWLRLAMTPAVSFANLPDVLLSYNVEPGGAARRSRRAYANVAAAQVRNFLITRNLRWLAGAFLTVVKSIVCAAQA